MGALENFLAMGGYARFVWPAYGVAVAVLLWMLVDSVGSYRSDKARARRARAAAAMTRKRRRLYLVLGGLGTLAVVSGLVLSAMSDNLVFFYSPSDLRAKDVPDGRRVRIGGLVENGSVTREADGRTIDVPRHRRQGGRACHL